MLFGTQRIQDNELEIGGIKVSELLQKHGSPLYVYDKAHIEDMIDAFQTNFSSDMFTGRVAYASKAFLTKAMVRLLTEKKMSLDCVSGGEMMTAVAGGFDMSKTIIHGNNKSIEELEMAIELNAGYIVVDSIYELEVLHQLASKRNKKINTLLRVNPGIEAHTHEYIITAKLTSKFGESIFDTEVLSNIMSIYTDNKYLRLSGFHCHIGSQVFGEEAFKETIKVMTDFVKEIEDRYDYPITTLNIGGGFGVFYVDGDTPIPLDQLLQGLVRNLEEEITSKNLNINEVIIEPGRSIVSNAGTTLYDIGYKKETYGGKNYVFVNGGMTDNIRPALYQAEYTADIATNMNGKKQGSWTVAGKLCESGDILIRETKLQEFHQGDILAIYTTGAYNYSMASNYNRILKPAVVFVENGVSEVVVRRETFEDLLRNDI